VKISPVSILAALTALLLWACQSTGPETAAERGKDLRSEIQTLQQQLSEQKQLLEGIKSDLAGIRKGIQEARPSPAQSEDEQYTVSIDDDYIKGQADAKLTMIEFSDFQCPFCERFYRETLPLIEKDYIRTGKVRMVYRDFPMEQIHKDAQKAAEAAQCAGEQGKYWEMHDAIFQNQKAMDVDHLKTYAKGLGLSADQFDQCLDSGKYVEEVKRDLIDGQALGVQGTPTFIVGPTGKDKIVRGVSIGGARPYDVFKQAFDRLLQEQRPGS
jgi:protein-disulfide isomerase